MVVTWASATGSATGASCKYGTSASALTNVATATGATYTLSKYTSPMLYKATLTHLIEGNKIYYYQCGSSTSGFSNILSFKSHPGVGSEGVTFHIIGDLGQTTNSETTLQELLDNEKALTGPSGGIISMGDLSYANGDEPLWDSFGNMKQFVSQNVPMMTTLGNHEWFDDSGYQFTAYKARYDNPLINNVKELYYSFDAGLVHWVMVAGWVMTCITL